MKAGLRYKFEGERLGLNLKCFKPIKICELLKSLIALKDTLEAKL